MDWEIKRGDSLTVLRGLESESVQCCVTSPPYWGLRDYGSVGQMGLESTPEAYIAAMTEVFREVRRVLRKDATCWVNMGDSYATGTTSDRSPTATGKHGYWQNPAVNKRIDGREYGLKPKDLCGIPWMLAFALRADGWYLRSDIIWHKPNPMPESVTDRPTKSHEYIFLLTKSERYFYDADAIKEASITGDPRKPYAPGQVDNRGDGHDRGGGTVRQRKPAGWETGDGAHGSVHRDGRSQAIEYSEIDATSRNKRSVWTIPTQAFPDAHFATFPEALITPCILAGSKTGDKILDPFAGSGTTGVVALRYHRNFLGIELNPEYAEMAERRITNDQPLFNGRGLLCR